MDYLLLWLVVQFATMAIIQKMLQLGHNLNYHQQVIGTQLLGVKDIL